MAEPYRRLAVIGHGGMADVHLAVADRPGASLPVELLVLKELRPGLAQDPDMRALFCREARVAVCMAHPNVVRTHALGEADGRPFIAMEFLEGPSLRHVLRRLQRDTGAGLPLALHLRVLVELLAGLHHAHEACDGGGRAFGLVHRDVTPHNVIVTHDGQVKLIDFGIVHVRDSEAPDGSFKGTVSYCAPEQARGGRVDRRADLFAVGVMLWEALMQRRMWAGLAPLEIAVRLEVGEVPPLPDGPHPELRALCRRALAVDRSLRPVTAARFAEQILRSMPEPQASQAALAAIVCEHFAAERADLHALIAARMHRSGEHDADAPICDLAPRAGSDSHVGSRMQPASPDEPTRPDDLTGRPRVTGASEHEEITHSSNLDWPAPRRPAAVAGTLAAMVSGVVRRVRRYVASRRRHGASDTDSQARRGG